MDVVQRKLSVISLVLGALIPPASMSTSTLTMRTSASEYWGYSKAFDKKKLQDEFDF